MAVKIRDLFEEIAGEIDKRFHPRVYYRVGKYGSRVYPVENQEEGSVLMGYLKDSLVHWKMEWTHINPAYHRGFTPADKKGFRVLVRVALHQGEDENGIHHCVCVGVYVYHDLDNTDSVFDD
jgi:hypothetical protein